MKVLLTNYNTLWGVINRPQSSNIYRHILSFNDEREKELFISKNLLDGKTIDESILDKPNIAMDYISELRATFAVQPKFYPNETIFSLLRKDFAIVVDKGVKRYYAVSPRKVGNSVVFDAELDVFFTYDIKSMFNRKGVRIRQAMTDRFYVNSEKRPEPIIYKPSFDFKSALYNSESFDNIDRNILIPHSDTESLHYDFSKYMAPDISDSDRKKINDFMNSMHFESVGYGSGWDEGGSGLGKFNLPYSIMCWPKSSNSFIVSIHENDFDGNQVGYMDYATYYNDFLKDAKVMKNSHHASGINIFVNALKNIPPDKFSISISTSDIHIKIVKDSFGSSGNEIALPLNGISAFKFPMAGLDSTFLFKINDYPVPADGTPEYTSALIPFSHRNYNLSPTQNVAGSHHNEIKAEFAPYSFIEVKTTSNNKIRLSPQYFRTPELKFSMGVGYMLEVNSQWIIPKNYNDFYMKKTPSKEGYAHLDENNYSLPTAIDPWVEFLARNKASQNASWLNKGLSFGVGALGLAAGVASGGASLGLTAVAGLSLAGKSAMGINSQLAHRKDIKNSPPDIVNTGSTLLLDSYLKGLDTKITRYRLDPQDDLLIREHFYKYGYNWNQKLHDINPLLTSRYYFNYIQADETFENIKLQSSAELKQLINDTIAGGITIWHVRDINNFKGIKNYDYENMEMSFNPAIKSTRKKKKKVKNNLKKISK